MESLSREPEWRGAEPAVHTGLREFKLLQRLYMAIACRANGTANLPVWLIRAQLLPKRLPSHSLPNPGNRLLTIMFVPPLSVSKFGQNM